MIATFTASKTGSYHDEVGYFISAGVSGEEPSHHLTFSRSLPVESNVDWGVEIEFDDQVTAAGNKISRCILARTRLGVEWMS